MINKNSGKGSSKMYKRTYTFDLIDNSKTEKHRFLNIFFLEMLIL